MRDSKSRVKQNRNNLIRKRRIRTAVLFLVMIFVVFLALVGRALVALPYESVDLCNLAIVDFGGYNNAGLAEVLPDDEAIDALLAKVKNDYHEAMFHNTNPNDEDYLKFRQSLEFYIDKTSGLSNGSVIKMTCSYDKELAKVLKIDISSVEREITVGGLPTVSRLSLDQVFEDLQVSFEGVSPKLTAYMSNTSTHPFKSRVGFEILDPQETYKVGDVVRVKANYSEQLSLETKYVVDVPSEECIKEYEVVSDSEYIKSSADLPAEILEEAVIAGKKAFVDANEYGVRIYCEANLVPVYINKKATFVYGTPKYVSSYLKTILPGAIDRPGYDYNDLDIIYSVVISQADGVTCTAYAAVRFANIIKNADGTYEYDFSNPKILSESYFSERVKTNVTESYATTHNIERVYAYRD